MIEGARSIPREIERIQLPALIVVVAGLALCVVAAVISPPQFFRSYLFAFVFWINLSLGCLGIALIHHLVASGWGATVIRFLEAASRLLPLMALLFVPLVFGLAILYPWARPDVVAADEVLKHKAIYLNVPFFLIRTVVYFAIWTAMAFFMSRWSSILDTDPDPEVAARLRKLGAGGLVVWGLTATFAFVDWAMSLEPHWFSTIYGGMVAMGGVLAAMAFVIVVLALVIRTRPFSEIVTDRILLDLGAFLLSFVVIWAYLQFSQWLVIWSGNLAEEVPWYLRRINGGWAWVAILLMVFHFALPFALLLSREAKRNIWVLALTAALVLVMRVVDVFWLVVPAFFDGRLVVSWVDLAALVGMGGIWLAGFVWQLKSRPIIPLSEPRLIEAALAKHAS